MATLAVTHPTLLDAVKAQDPNGMIADTAELLQERNEWLQYATFQEGNLATGNQVNVRTGQPAATLRKMNAGVASGKATQDKVTEGCADIQANMEVDEEVANLNGNLSSFLANESVPFINAMNEQISDSFIYGDPTTNTENFMGLSERYNDTTAANGENIILGGGAGSDNHSIWLVGWSPQTIYMHSPKGKPGGLRVENRGRVTLYDSNNNPYDGYRMTFKWNVGLTVKNWQYAVRIANIDNSDLVISAATGANLIDLMIQAEERFPSFAGVRPVWLVNREIRSWLRRQINQKTNNNLTYDTISGRRVLAFSEIPVARCDALLNATEATVS